MSTHTAILGSVQRLRITLVSTDPDVDVSAASAGRLVARKPSGDLVTWTGTLSGAGITTYNGQAATAVTVTYTTVAVVDLSVVGYWHLRVEASVSGDWVQGIEGFLTQLRVVPF